MGMIAKIKQRKVEKKGKKVKSAKNPSIAAQMSHGRRVDGVSCCFCYTFLAVREGFEPLCKRSQRVPEYA